MITQPMDVLQQHQVRKSKKQKQAFRDAVLAYAAELGYDSTVEKGSMGVQNLVMGNPKCAKYLVTAHYDTPARMIFPNLITPCSLLGFLSYQILITLILLLPAIALGIAVGVLTRDVWFGELVYFVLLFAELVLMLAGPANPSTANDNTSGVVTVLEMMRTLPPESRSDVCFVLFDLEEAGLLGSSAYRKAHKQESDGQVVLNLDCVGDGDEIIFFPGKKLIRNQQHLAHLKRVSGTYAEKKISVRDKGFSVYPSDQKHFPLGVGIAAFRRSKLFGPYCSRIHTPKDTVLEEANVKLLRDCLIQLITNNGNLEENK